MSQNIELFVPRQRTNSKGSLRVSTAAGSTSVKDKAIAHVTHPFHDPSKLSGAISDGYTASSGPATSAGASSDSGSFNLLEPNVNLMTEAKSLDAMHEVDIWTIIEVTGEVGFLVQNEASIALDVVIVLDCSACSSDYCLTSAVENVLHISHILDPDHDRLAIVASSQRHATNKCLAGCVIRPLKSPEPTSIEANLRQAVNNRMSHMPGEVDLGENLVAAFRLLGYPDGTHPQQRGPLKIENSYPASMSSPTVPKSRQPTSMVVVISPNPGEFCDVLAPVAPVPIHVVQPGVIPWRWSEPPHSGWQLSTSYLQMKSSSPRTELKKLIDSARSPSNPGPLKDLKLELEPLSGCSIGRIIGKVSHHFLKPGETWALALQIQVPKWKEKLDPHMPVAKSRSSLNDTLIANLESMVGVAHQDLFTVTVFYNDGRSNQQFTQSQSTTCSIERHNPDSSWLGCSLAELASSQELLRISTYKRLMLLAAQTYSLSDIKCVIDEIIPASKLNGVLKAAKNLLDSEINYQLDLGSRLEHPTSFQTAINPRDASGRETANLDPESCRLSISSKANSIESDEPPTKWSAWWIKDPSHRARIHSGENTSTYSGSSTATTIRHEAEGIEDTKGHDKARAIWKLMRRDSKSKTQPSQGRISSNGSVAWSGENRERTRREEAIRQQALRSKRSIGAETLRSLSLDTSPKMIEGHAPWL